MVSPVSDSFSANMPGSSHRNWLLTSLHWRGSITPVVFPRALLFGGLAIAVIFLHRYQPQLPWDVCQYLVNNVAINLILGLLLVFRTNTAYERFWEGHRSWGQIIATLRTLLREVENLELDNAKEAKNQALVWLVTLAIATKEFLRQTKTLQQINTLLTKVEAQKLAESIHPPLLILRWLETFTREHVPSAKQELFRERYGQLASDITACEGMICTPVPFAYSIFLKQLILLYCFILPFGLVEEFVWGTIPLTMLVSAILIGVEAIAAEIEDPFGKDENDLPLDELCNRLVAEAKEFGILDQGQPQN